MTDQVVVILDDPLLDADPWADLVFADAKLTAVDNGAVIKAMVKDPEAKKALLANAGDPMAAQEKLTRYYRAALDQLYGDQPRIGIYGTAWLIHVDKVAACVVDWSEVIRLANAPGVNPQDREFSISMAKDFLHARVDKYMPDCSRYHELEPLLPMPERVERTLAFLRDWGV